MSLPAGLKTPIRTNVSLKSYSTFKIGGPARFFSEPETREGLLQALEFRRMEGLPLLVIGRGSNLLISDAGFSGLVLSLRQFEPYRYQADSDGLFHVSGGMSLFRLAALTQVHSLGGAEFVCHIPGTVGGAVIMNAGFGRRGHAYREMKEIVESVTVLDIEANHTERTLRARDIRFEYRKTDLPPHVIVLEAVLRLAAKRQEWVEREIRENFAYRNLVQDLRFPSAGSTFKNSKDSSLSSGQLLEQVQMKGMQIGGARVSERHANFFLNVDHATAQDVLSLMATAKKRVFEKFGIQLEPEVRYVESNG
ncbi:MAG: UDP-N-acetylmuramate dehydrogenase [Candidatus Omnitrophica bacterium]|nr:UDP-N-acetylmuramate dehydrogenase [Candidatus Omnitrophota bacterium]